MNHPSREEWMSYLYRESSAGERTKLAAHLQACPDCQALVSGWQAARKDLDAWKLQPRAAALPAKQAPLAPVAFVLKWAVAAALVLGVGFGLGRFTSPAADAQKVRAAIEPEIREQTKQLLTDFAAALEAARAEDRQAVYAALDKLDAQRLADYLSLKKDLDTVAVNTDAGLRRTERQLVSLADATQPVSSPSLPQQ